VDELEKLSVYELGNMFAAILDSGQYSDVTLLVQTKVDGIMEEEKQFRAHKCITLASVFAAMFASNTRESQENRVIINDIGSFDLLDCH